MTETIKIWTTSNEFEKMRNWTAYYLKDTFNFYGSSKIKNIPNKNKVIDVLEKIVTLYYLLNEKTQTSKKRNDENLIYSLNYVLIENDFNVENKNNLISENRSDEGLESLVQNYINFVGFIGKRYPNEVIDHTLDFIYTESINRFKKILKKYYRENEIFLNKEQQKIIVDNIPIPININSIKRNNTEIEKVPFDEKYKIVGNEELQNTLRKSMIFLSTYDPILKRNHLKEELDSFYTLLIYGPPGTGKTISIKNAIYILDKFSKKLGNPYEVIELTNSFKSGVFNESVKNLVNIENKTKRRDKAYLIIVDDADTIFSSRKELGNSNEERKIIGEMLRFLDDIHTNPYGNVFLIATSNEPNKIDKALLDRLNKKSIYVKGPQNPGEYIQIFKNKLSKGIKKGYIQITDWNKIGEIAKEVDLGGRGVENVCTRLSDKILDADLLEEYVNYIANPTNKDVSILDFVKKVKDEDLIEEIKNYSQERLRQNMSYV